MDMHNGCYRPKGNFYIAPGVPRADVGCLRPCGTWDNLVNWSQVMLDAGPVLVPVTFVCVCAVAAAAEAGYNVCRNGVLAARMRIQTTAEYLATSSQELATAIADRAQEFFEAGQGALLQIGDGREQSSDSEDASDYRTALGEPNLDEEDNEDQDDGNAATSSRQGMNNNDYDDDDDTRRPILISSDEEAADDEDRHNPRRNGKGPMYPQTSRPRPRLSGQAYYEAVQRYLRQPVATNEASPFSHNARQPSQRDHLTQRRRARTPLNFDLNEPASPPSHG